MRYEVILGDTTNPAATNLAHPNSIIVPLWWNPNIILLQNLTSNPLFYNEGRLSLPTVTSYDGVCPPGATLRLPTNSKEFAVFLPLTPPLTDVTQIAKVIWDQVPNA